MSYVEYSKSFLWPSLKCSFWSENRLAHLWVLLYHYKPSSILLHWILTSFFRHLCWGCAAKGEFRNNYYLQNAFVHLYLYVLFFSLRLSPEQVSMCQYRYKFLTYLDRLSTYEVRHSKSTVYVHSYYRVRCCTWVGGRMLSWQYLPLLYTKLVGFSFICVK